MSTSYYPGTIAAGTKPATDLDGDEGTLVFRATPRLNADPASGDEQCLIACGSTAGAFEVLWDGIVGGGEYAYLALRVNGTEVARCYTYHIGSSHGSWTEADRLNIEVRWGGTPTRCELTVNGWCTNRRLQDGSLDAVDPTLPFTPHATAIAVGQRHDGSAVFDGVIEHLAVSDTRLPTHWRISALGDSLTQEPNGASLKSWSRHWATLATSRGHVVNAGRNGDQYANIAARLQDEVIEYVPQVCVLGYGTNDIVAGADAATILANDATLCASLAAEGIAVILCTIPPFGNAAQYTAPREAVRATVNAARALVPANVWRVVDLSTLLTDGGTPPALAAAYDGGDGLHFSQAGYDAVGAEIFSEGWTETADVSATSALTTSISATSAHNPTITAVAA